MKTKHLYFLIALFIAGFAACKKTINYDPLAQNRITEYKVVNVQDTVIYGSIDNIQNTITVYVPYYYGMTVIQPSIKVDAGASLSAQALPVEVSDVSQTYTVKGADGSTRTYKLIITQQNPPSLSLEWRDADPVNVPGGEITVITGNFQSTNTSTLKITLQGTTSNQTINPDMSTAFVVTTVEGKGGYIMSVKTPTSIDSGLYNVKVSFLGNNVTMDKPVHVYYPTPSIAPTWNTQTVAAGDTLAFIPNGTGLFYDLKTVTAKIQGQNYNIPIKSTNRLGAVITFPDGLPIGSWGSVPFVFQFGNFNPVTTTVPLIVKAKGG
ncbi:hypothetical protein AAFN85_25250 [Mucilaginibacter sp. CAU 1740]|uniref:hypothetical protein n=1 Tax=Mucilaginibacter sp. CAU 1740 TaxID=3140365 RepID=UPI00325BFD24